MTTKILAASLAFALLTGASAARADDTKQACIDASEKGQTLRDDHKLRAAREQFLACARDVCPGPIKRDCGDWLAGINKAMPSLMIVAHDHGQDVVKVSVDLDGKRVQESLDGVAIPIDPGPHTLRFTTTGRAPIEQTVVAREGDKGRQLVVEFGAAGSVGDNGSTPPPPPPGTAPSTFHVPLPAWVLGGVTVVAAGSFTILGVTGKSELSHLRETCPMKPDGCSQSQVDSTHTKLLVADISLYTGIATLAAATVITILANRKPAAAATTGSARPSLTIRF